MTRVWDVYFSEGFKIVYRVALALLKTIEKDLLAAQFEDIMGILRNIPDQVLFVCSFVGLCFYIMICLSIDCV